MRFLISYIAFLKILDSYLIINSLAFKTQMVSRHASRTTQTLWCCICILIRCLAAAIKYFILIPQDRILGTICSLVTYCRKMIRVFCLPHLSLQQNILLENEFCRVIINIKDFRERCFRLQGALSLWAALVSSLCLFFKEQAGKLNLAAQWAQSHSRENKTSACCFWWWW